jgi:hypothetical protein
MISEALKMITSSQFRLDYPEFKSTGTFPDATVNYWLNFAYLMLNTNAWGSMLDFGVELFVAHNLIIEAINLKMVAIGGLPGINRGAINSESPGQVSISYDTANASIQKAGHWNITTYGTRYWGLAKAFACRPLSTGPGHSPGFPGSYTPYF